MIMYMGLLDLLGKCLLSVIWLLWVLDVLSIRLDCGILLVWSWVMLVVFMRRMIVVMI